MWMVVKVTLFYHCCVVGNASVDYPHLLALRVVMQDMMMKISTLHCQDPMLSTSYDICY